MRAASAASHSVLGRTRATSASPTYIPSSTAPTVDVPCIAASGSSPVIVKPAALGRRQQRLHDVAVRRLGHQQQRHRRDPTR